MVVCEPKKPVTPVSSTLPLHVVSICAFFECLKVTEFFVIRSVKPGDPNLYKQKYSGRHLKIKTSEPEIQEEVQGEFLGLDQGGFVKIPGIEIARIDVQVIPGIQHIQNAQSRFHTDPAD